MIPITILVRKRQASMKTYTVHFPKGAAAISADALAGATLVRDGFSWGAFLFGPFWLFWHRAWLAGFAVLAAQFAVSTAFDILAVPALPAGIANLAVMILTGLEAPSLRRWTLERNRRPVAGIVSGRDMVEAEAKMIALGLHRLPRPDRNANPPPARPISTLSVPSSPAAPSSDALGLFPLLERPK